jgi:radical SAM family uncharacterized protein/radical SAM-linked protein
MSRPEHPYASFAHRVQKPARYLGGEFGATRKDWAGVRARVCLAFPDLYDIGMSHLGFKILYKILNDDPRTLAERCYAPWVDMEAELRARKVPLVSLESARPLSEFDVIGFSLQFELTYTNVLSMLELGNIPLRSKDRADGDPLVVAGGPTATHPEPLAAFVDAFVIGDGEERTTEVALAWTELNVRGVPRAERLRELSRLRGVYVPSLHSTHVDPDSRLEVVDGACVQRNLVEDLNRFPFPDDGPIGGPEAIFDRMSIEIARGCTEGCRFCQAGMIYRPVRERGPEQIVGTIVSSLKKSGYDEASLTSLSTADHSCIAPLIKKVVDVLAPEKVSLGVSSLRAYGLGEDVLDDLSRVRATGVTFAPEAGSQRMRDVVNKNVTEEQLMTTAERVFSRGWSAMKLYFMIGLPTEEESDVREIVRVGRRAREVGKRVKKAKNGGGAPKVTVSVSTHVPKPHTPFQWCAMDGAAQITEKQRWLTDEAKGAGVDLRMHDSDGSWLEGIFARGDRRLSNVLERAYRAGARFDSWEDQLKIDVWKAALAAEGLDPTLYLSTLPVSARLPWDHIDVGLEEGFLAREYRKAMKSRLSPPCGKIAGTFVHPTNVVDAQADARKLVCYDCGVACDLSAMASERLVSLRKLGAEAPRVRAPEPPKRLAQGEARRYRFAYAKLGPSAYLSHLDLIRALPRAFRRVDLPLYYTQGFHPKPDMSFGPALSLGVWSLSEMLDVKLTVDVDPSLFLDGLSASCPDGMRFALGARLGPQDAGITRVVDTASYSIAIPKSALPSIAWLVEQVERVRGAAELPVMRRIEGLGKRVDVRAFLRQIALTDDGTVAAAGLVGDFAVVAVDLEIRGGGAVKIAEVVEVLGGDALPFRAVRSALGLWRNERVVSPMNLGDCRKLPSSAKSVVGPRHAN